MLPSSTPPFTNILLHNLIKILINGSSIGEPEIQNLDVGAVVLLNSSNAPAEVRLHLPNLAVHVVKQISDELTGLCIPHLHHSIGAGDNEVVVVLDTRDGTAVATQNVFHVSRVRIPDSHRRVCRSRHQCVLGKSDQSNKVLVAFQDGGCLASVQIPDPHSVVGRTRYTPVFLHVQDTAVNLVGVTRKHPFAVSSTEVPDTGIGIVTSVQQDVGEPTNGANRSVVATQNLHQILVEVLIQIDWLVWQLVVLSSDWFQDVQTSHSRGVTTENMGTLSLLDIPDPHRTVCGSCSQDVSQVFHCPHSSCMAREHRSKLTGVCIVDGDGMIVGTSNYLFVVELQTCNYIGALPWQSNTTRLEAGISPSFADRKSASVHQFSELATVETLVDIFHPVVFTIKLFGTGHESVSEKQVFPEIRHIVEIAKDLHGDFGWQQRDQIFPERAPYEVLERGQCCSIGFLKQGPENMVDFRGATRKHADHLGNELDQLCFLLNSLNGLAFGGFDGVDNFVVSELPADDAVGEVMEGVPTGMLSTSLFLFGGLEPVLLTIIFPSTERSVISESADSITNPPVLRRFLEVRESVSLSCAVSVRSSVAWSSASRESGRTELRLILDSGNLIELTHGPFETEFGLVWSGEAMFSDNLVGTCCIVVNI